MFVSYLNPKKKRQLTERITCLHLSQQQSSGAYIFFFKRGRQTYSEKKIDLQIKTTAGF